MCCSNVWEGKDQIQLLKSMKIVWACRANGLDVALFWDSIVYCLLHPKQYIPSFWAVGTKSESIPMTSFVVSSISINSISFFRYCFYIWDTNTNSNLNYSCNWLCINQRLKTVPLIFLTRLTNKTHWDYVVVIVYAV